MFKDVYRKELDSLCVSDSFKKSVIDQLQAARENEEQSRQKDTAGNKIIAFPKMKWAKIRACAAVIILSALTFSTAFIKKDEQITPMLYSAGGYTKADARDISPVGVKAVSAMMVPYTFSQEGMGFEGYVVKDISELYKNPPADARSINGNLKIYESNPMSDRQTFNLAESLLRSIGKDAESAEKEYTWQVPIYHEDIWAGNSSRKTAEYVPPRDDSFLYSVSYTFNGGQLEIYPGRARAHLTVSAPENLTDEKSLLSWAEKLSQKLGLENPEGYSYTDYTFSGDKHPFLYVYDNTGDTSDTLFAHSLANISIYQYRESDDIGIWINLPAYKDGQQLPAITINQALGLLYNGDYYTSRPESITDESTVAMAELVYLDAYYDVKTCQKSGYAIPFYKFYVQLESQDYLTPEGFVTYCTYYVPAIHPAYLQISDEISIYN